MSLLKKYYSNALTLIGVSALLGFTYLSEKAAEEFKGKPMNDLKAYTNNFKQEKKNGTIFEGNLHIDSIAKEKNILYTSIGRINCNLWENWQANSALMGDSTMPVAIKKMGYSSTYETILTPEQKYRSMVMNGSKFY